MRKVIIIISIISLLFTAQLNCFAEVKQISPNPNFTKQVEENYRKLLSADFNERNTAVSFFSALKKNELKKEIIRAAVKLFEIEQRRQKEFDDVVENGANADDLPKDIAYINSEEYGMYHVNLCKIVGKSGDESLLPQLIDTCLMAEVITNFRQAAVEPLIELILKHDEDPTRKEAAISILGEMLQPKKKGYVAHGHTRNSIKQTLLKATSDEDQYVRSAAITALGTSEDQDVVPELEKITERDEERMVKENAERTLKKLKKY